MNSSAICFLLFTLGLVLISHAPLHAEAEKGKVGKNLIAGVCNETLEDRANCMRAVGSDPNVLKAKNYLQLSEAILQIALKKGKEGQKFLKGLVASNNNSPAIKDCDVEYDGIVMLLSSSLDELTTDAFVANYEATIASNGPYNCVTQLENASVVNPVLSTLNSEISLLGKIASKATDHL